MKDVLSLQDVLDLIVLSCLLPRVSEAVLGPRLAFGCGHSKRAEATEAAISPVTRGCSPFPVVTPNSFYYVVEGWGEGVLSFQQHNEGPDLLQNEYERRQRMFAKISPFAHCRQTSVQLNTNSTSRKWQKDQKKLCKPISDTLMKKRTQVSHTNEELSQYFYLVSQSNDLLSLDIENISWHWDSKPLFWLIEQFLITIT